MRSIRNISLFLSSVLFLSGCGGHYEVQVNGFMDTAKNIVVKPDAMVAVIYDPKAANPKLEKEVETKIEKLLALKGYKIGPVRDSEYYLFFWYGIGKGSQVPNSLPVSQLGNTNQSPAPAVQLAANKSDSDTDYSRWLQLKLIDGKRYGETNDTSSIWVGEAISTGPNSDLGEVIDYLLIPAFDHFCANTGKKLTVTVLDGDKRIKDLMRSR